MKSRFQIYPPFQPMLPKCETAISRGLSIGKWRFYAAISGSHKSLRLLCAPVLTVQQVPQRDPSAHSLVGGVLGGEGCLTGRYVAATRQKPARSLA